MVKAEVASSGLKTDDALDYAMDVTAPLRVLIVSGDAVDQQKAEAAGSASPATQVSGETQPGNAATSATAEAPKNAGEFIRLALHLRNHRSDRS